MLLRIQWVLSLSIFFFGIFTLDFHLTKWFFLHFTVYSLPLFFQVLPFKVFRISVLWFGVFFILQTFMTLLIKDPEFKTLVPNMHRTVDVRGGLPGISGKQVMTTDERGFRVTKKIDYDSSETFRIFTIGGSTTEQIRLDDHATWSYHIQNYLSKKREQEVEVINTGVSGLRVKHHVATLENILDLHPDVVIFLVGVNDWNWHIKDAFLNKGPLRNFLRLREKLFLRESLVGRLILSQFISLKAKLGSGLEYGDYYTHQRDSLNREVKHSFFPEEVHPQYTKELLRLADICEANDLPCAFVTQPNGYQGEAKEDYKKGFWMTPPNQDYAVQFESMVHIAKLYNDHLLQFTKEKGLHVCDIANELSPTFENFYDDCHFNTLGSKKASVPIGHCIEKLIP